MTALNRRRRRISRRSYVRSRLPIRSRVDLLLSAQLGRHGPGGQREELQAKDVRWLDGRSAGDRVQEPARPLLNGCVNYETWVPSKGMMFAGTEEFFKKYQSRARPQASIRSATISAAGDTPISRCWAMPSGAKSLDDNKLADYIGKNTFKTIHGQHQVRRQRRMGEAAHDAGAVSRSQAGLRPRGLPRHGHQTVLTPDEYKTGTMIYPYEKAK